MGHIAKQCSSLHSGYHVATLEVLQQLRTRATRAFTHDDASFTSPLNGQSAYATGLMRHEALAFKFE